MKKICILGLAALVSFQTIAQTETAKVDTFKKVATPEGYTSQIDVVYVKVKNGEGKGKDWDGRMDLYVAPNDGRKPTPVVMHIHGGGWNKGVKESQSGFSTYFKMGYTVANVEYRLSGQATAPAAVEDVRCALIYLINHAKELNIDPERIVVSGGSAGGHLALMAGLLGNDHKFDNNCDGKKTNVKVAAIIDQYGITDVWDWGFGKIKTSRSATQWLGAKKDDQKFAESVSPINYVTKNSPPIFIVHGNADPVVPYEHSVWLDKKLTEVGVKHEFITVEGGEHGKFTAEKKKEINGLITKFLTELGLNDKPAKTKKTKTEEKEEE